MQVLIRKMYADFKPSLIDLEGQTNGDRAERWPIIANRQNTDRERLSERDAFRQLTPNGRYNAYAIVQFVVRKLLIRQ